MLERKALQRLTEWSNNGKKPLLIYGQRQVGKTYLIKEFARLNFKTVIYADLSRDDDFRSVFKDRCPNVESIMLSIRTLRSIEACEPSETILLLDEIQDCDGALSALKVFAEDGRYHVIASGSMLGVLLHPSTDDSSYSNALSPMGYTEPFQMRSLDFEEFLWAMGIPHDSIDYVRSSIHGHTAISDAIYARLSELYRIYFIVGGMPAAVNAFLENRETFRNASRELDSILVQVHKDINRYNRGMDAVKTAECFDSLPSQLAQSNKRFHYSRVGGEDLKGNSRRSADKYMGNLLWIRDAGYGNFVYSLAQIHSPLVAQVKRDLFKVYLSDTGMLTHLYGDPAIIALYSSDISFNLGALMENAVAEALVKCGYVPYYYQNNNGDARMEVDFVVEFSDGPVAIEVKSGRDRNSPSLGKVADRFPVKRRIMLEHSNIFLDPKGVLHLPLFASAFLDSLDDVPSYLR